MAATGSGVIVLTSSSGRELSVEKPDWANGAFTEAVLEALTTRADSDRNGLISMLEMTSFLTDWVPEITGGKQTPGIDTRLRQQRLRRGACETMQSEGDCRHELRTLAAMLLRWRWPWHRRRRRRVSWQDAVGELAAERTRAETCVEPLEAAWRRRPRGRARLRARLAYDEAKAEIDGVVAGLSWHWRRARSRKVPASLEARLGRGVQGREALCEKALALAPAEDGTR